MFAKKFRKALAIAVVTLTALFVGGTATVASALSVDVTNFHYSDDSGRSILYENSHCFFVFLGGEGKTDVVKNVEK